MPALDRTPQHLPLAIGDLAAVHGKDRVHRFRSWWYRRWRAVVVTAGITALAAGAALSRTHATVAVFAVGSTVHVGTSVLSAVPARADEYRGDAALVLQHHGDGTIVAASSTVARGAVSRSLCVLTHLAGTSLEERCRFDINSRSVGSVDHLNVGDDGDWHRRYDDGQEVRISVPADGAVVPVPFPIGR